MEERKKEKKENSTELQKPNVEAEVYNNKKHDWEKNRKRKSSVSFHSANKINNHNRGGEKEKKKREREKKFQKNYRTSQNVRIINVFLESLLSESFPSLGVTVHLTSLGCL